MNRPLDSFALAELHGLSHGGRKVDVPLVCSLGALNDLNLCGMSHDIVLLLMYSIYTRLQKTKIQAFFRPFNSSLAFD